MLQFWYQNVLPCHVKVISNTSNHGLHLSAFSLMYGHVICMVMLRNEGVQRCRYGFVLQAYMYARLLFLLRERGSLNVISRGRVTQDEIPLHSVGVHDVDRWTLFRTQKKLKQLKL